MRDSPNIEKEFSYWVARRITGVYPVLPLTPLTALISTVFSPYLNFQKWKEERKKRKKGRREREKNFERKDMILTDMMSKSQFNGKCVHLLPQVVNSKSHSLHPVPTQDLRMMCIPLPVSPLAHLNIL